MTIEDGGISDISINDIVEQVSHIVGSSNTLDWWKYSYLKGMKGKINDVIDLIVEKSKKEGFDITNYLIVNHKTNYILSDNEKGVAVEFVSAIDLIELKKNPFRFIVLVSEKETIILTDLEFKKRYLHFDDILK